jgi:ribonuclease HI
LVKTYDINTAEYMAMLLGIQEARKYTQQINVFTDSSNAASVLDKVLSGMTVNSKWTTASDIIKGISIQIFIIGRDANWKVDNLIREGIYNAKKIRGFNVLSTT